MATTNPMGTTDGKRKPKKHVVAKPNAKGTVPTAEVRRRKPRGKRKSSLFFRRWPSWWLWLGAAVAVILYVIIFYFFVSPYSFRWKAYYGEPTFPEGYEVRGIDVSHHQGSINWERLRNARMCGVPVSFVIIKATEGLTLADDCFQRNFMQARRNSIVRGAYHYFKPTLDARSQANFFLRTVALEPGDLPPILDVEETGNMTTAELRSKVKVWLDVVEREYNIKPMIYTGRKFKQEYLYGKDFDEYPLWLAHYYVNEMTYNGSWAIWQHTDVGSVDGIRGNVDCNIFNGSLEELNQLTIMEESIEE